VKNSAFGDPSERNVIHLGTRWYAWTARQTILAECVPHRGSSRTSGVEGAIARTGCGRQLAQHDQRTETDVEDRLSAYCFFALVDDLIDGSSLSAGGTQVTLVEKSATAAVTWRSAFSEGGDP